MRICSLLPSATEIVASLGLVESLVAVSEECDWPAEVCAIPVVTASRVDTTRLSSVEIDQAVREAIGDGRPLYAIDRELLDALEPDLILTQNLCAVCAVFRRERRRALRHRGRDHRARRPHARRDRRAHPLARQFARRVGPRPHSRR
jgi:iron complex transport system substrate-binding protein